MDRRFSYRRIKVSVWRVSFLFISRCDKFNKNDFRSGKKVGKPRLVIESSEEEEGEEDTTKKRTKRLSFSGKSRRSYSVNFKGRIFTGCSNP